MNARRNANSDDTLSNRDAPYYLECAEEDEAHILKGVA